ncbi:guanine nucleotide-binding protein subunit gamma 4-like [Maniola jurtina]|uniref:guanine nucleotide-binding protein subunit gamma 4-like n=1 Tax=Maniola jurtina TaxID=191418 RepID=UPI001E68EDAE|nr:guanine nucleotide-binding protein subunit gamma 4-like [Maniola jurtina]
MEYRIVIFAFAALLCQVQSQLCYCPEVEVISCPPMVSIPQVPTTPIIPTTVVDNSVTTALLNALQLLIVKDILQSQLGPSCLPNLFPIETPCYEYISPITSCATPIASCATPIASCATPIASYATSCATPVATCANAIATCATPIASCATPIASCAIPVASCATPISSCATPIEVISPVIEPYPYLGGCTEISYPNIGCASNYYPCGTEYVNQYVPTCGNAVVTIPYNNGRNICYNELVTSIPYNSCGEIISTCSTYGTPETIPLCGQCYGIPEVITSNCNCNYGNPYNTFGVTEYISPCNPGCGVQEIIQPCIQYYSGCPEVISPICNPGCAGMPEVIPANPYGCCREIVTPCNPGCSGFDFCGAPATFCGNSIGSCAPAAEVFIPSCIPAQLTGNFGYSPTLGPCINFNIEPVPFGSCLC